MEALREAVLEDAPTQQVPAVKSISLRIQSSKSFGLSIEEDAIRFSKRRRLFCLYEQHRCIFLVQSMGLYFCAPKRPSDSSEA